MLLDSILNRQVCVRCGHLSWGTWEMRKARDAYQFFFYSIPHKLKDNAVIIILSIFVKNAQRGLLSVARQWAWWKLCHQRDVRLLYSYSVNCYIFAQAQTLECVCVLYYSCTVGEPLKSDYIKLSSILFVCGAPSIVFVHPKETLWPLTMKLIVESLYIRPFIFRGGGPKQSHFPTMHLLISSINPPSSKTPRKRTTSSEGSSSDNDKKNVFSIGTNWD